MTENEWKPYDELHIRFERTDPSSNMYIFLEKGAMWRLSQMPKRSQRMDVSTERVNNCFTRLPKPCARVNIASSRVLYGYHTEFRSYTESR